MHFYGRVLQALMSRDLMRADDTVLAVCAGTYDVQTLRGLGLTRVTISNLQEDFATECAPFLWAREDAEDLSFADGSFDWVIVHAGLHHCRSPHRGLLEMCRVARKGIVVLEARDSLMLRTAERLGLVATYELEAVVLQDFAAGGVRNSAVPNFVYRWTEREVEKAVASAYPQRRNVIHYFYGMRLPTERLEMAGFAKRTIARILGLGASLMQRVLPRQGNEFGFAVLHDAPLQPWMADDGREMRRDFDPRFDPSRFRPSPKGR